MNPLPWLKYQHLYYFMIIAREGGVTHAAKKLRLSQSSLSTQLKTLENSLGKSLFKREGRRLKLTTKGQIALDYAEDIFRMGEELLSQFSDDANDVKRPISIGALSPLSKNLQYEIIRPLVMGATRTVRVVEGEYLDLLGQLKKHQIDLLLSNLAPGGLDTNTLSVHLLGEMPVYLVGRPPFKIPKKKFPKWLEGIPLFLPSTKTSARVDFDAILVRANIQATIQAEVDDTALLRLLALSGSGIALIPEIGVKFELEQKRLLKIEKIPGLYERFYAITARKKFIPQSIIELINNAQIILNPRGK